MKKTASILLLFLCCCTLANCGALMWTGPGAEFRRARDLFTEKKYTEAADTYRKLLKDSPKSSWAADARFGLASTLAYHDNPQRNYAQALQEFEEFLKLYPGSKKADEAQNWKHVLKIVVETRKENERLTQNIEQLKRLDVRHEEKRRRGK